MSIIINYKNAGHYKSKEWLAMEEKERQNLRRIDSWEASEGEPRSVKNGNLYIGGKKVYQFKRWGMSAGEIAYVFGNKKYKMKNAPLNERGVNYLKQILKPFHIPIVPRKELL